MSTIEITFKQRMEERADEMESLLGSKENRKYESEMEQEKRKAMEEKRAKYDPAEIKKAIKVCMDYQKIRQDDDLMDVVSYELERAERNVNEIKTLSDLRRAGGDEIVEVED